MRTELQRKLLFLSVHGHIELHIDADDDDYVQKSNKTE